MTDDLCVGKYVSLPGFESEKFLVARSFRGGMGVVYQLLSPRSDRRTCALKTLLTTADPDQFRRECEVWSALGGHKYVATPLWYGYVRSEPAILLEWYPRSLDREIGRKWSERSIVTVICGIAFALRHAYERFRVLHRDIKPSNILLTENLEPKVGDWGIASLSPRTMTLGLEGDEWHGLHTGISGEGIAGTLAYMAPEILLSESPQSVSTDIYSLGATIYEVLVGVHPFFQPGYPVRFDLPAAIARLEAVLAWTDTRKHRMIEVLTHAIHPDPTRRFSDYDALLSACDLPYRPSEPPPAPEDFALQMQFYRTEGQLHKAWSLLQDSKSMRLQDYVVAMETAKLLLCEGDWESATSELERAIQYARQRGSPILEPALALARIHLDDENPQEAEQLLREAESDGGDNVPISAHPELAWLSLRRGSHKEAYFRAKVAIRVLEASDDLLCWMTLAAYDGGFLEAEAAHIARCITSAKSPGFGAALCAILLCSFTPVDLATELLHSVYHYKDSWTPRKTFKGFANNECLTPPVPEHCHAALVDAIKQQALVL